MKRFFKSTAMFVAIVMVISLFSGCSVDELKLLDAIRKTAEINSMISTSSVDLHVTTSGMTRAQKKAIMPFVNMIDEMNIATVTKTSTNTENTISKTSSESTFTMADVSTKLSMWQDVNLTWKAKRSRLIVEMPSAVLSLFPYPAVKKYWVNNFVEPSPWPTAMPGESPLPTAQPLSALNYKSIIGKYIEMIGNMSEKFSVGFDTIKKTPDTVVGGKTYSNYQLSLTDKTLKDVLRYLGNGYVNNKAVTNEIKKFLISTITSNSSQNQASMYTTLIEGAFDSFQKDHKSFTKSFNKMMDNIKDVNLLGSKGIVVDFSVNPEGYIDSVKGVIDLSFNIEKLSAASLGLPAPSPKPTGLLNITVDFSETLTDINLPVTVVVPKTSNANSFNMNNIPKFYTPAKLYVNPPTNLSKSISGTADANASLEINIVSSKDIKMLDSYLKMGFPIEYLPMMSGVKPIKLTADTFGSFKYTLKKPLVAGSAVYIYADNYYQTIRQTHRVKDLINPKTPVVYKSKSSAAKVIGKAEPRSTVVVKRNGKFLGKTKVQSNGYFSVKIPTQKLKTVLSVSARDASYNRSKSAKYVVTK